MGTKMHGKWKMFAESVFIYRVAIWTPTFYYRIYGCSQEFSPLDSKEWEPRKECPGEEFHHWNFTRGSSVCIGGHWVIKRRRKAVLGLAQQRIELPAYVVSWSWNCRARLIVVSNIIAPSNCEKKRWTVLETKASLIIVQSPQGFVGLGTSMCTP